MASSCCGISSLAVRAAPAEGKLRGKQSRANSGRRFFTHRPFSTPAIFAQKAEQHFRTAQGINTNAAAAPLGIARSLLKQGKLAESTSYFRTAASPLILHIKMPCSISVRSTIRPSQNELSHRNLPRISRQRSGHQTTYAAPARNQQRARRHSESGSGSEARAHYQQPHGADRCLPADQPERQGA